MENKGLWKKLSEWKYPLLLLALGILILAFPGSVKKESREEPCSELQQLLSAADGVGEARVLISEHGVIVVCEGEPDPKVKLDIIRAVNSYTGFGSDKITILRLTDQGKGRKGS